MFAAPRAGPYGTGRPGAGFVR